MAKREVTTIDALFSSKTRVKLLHLFFNNPGKAFYVREITRLIDEQINSVRRELSNMMGVGIIISSTADNKLYYEVNQRYEHFGPFREIFAGKRETVKHSHPTGKSKQMADPAWMADLKSNASIRIAVTAGTLVKGSACPIDLLIVGSVAPGILKSLISNIEKIEGHEIHYTALAYDEFYYRLSVKDKFISDIVSNRHEVVVDEDHVLDRI